MSWLMDAFILLGALGLFCWFWWAMIEAQTRIDGVNEPGCKTRSRYRR